MRIFIVSLAASLLFLPSVVSAATTKVGYVNVPYLINNAPQAKAASNQLKDKFQDRQEKIQAKQKEYRELKKKLDKDNLVMSDEKKDQTQDKLSDLERDIKRKKKAFRQDVNVKKNEAFKGVRKQVQKAVQTFAKDKGYDLIVGRGAMYSSERVNITKKVLEQLKDDYDGSSN